MIFNCFKWPHTKASEGTNVDANQYYIKNLRKILKFIGTDFIDPEFKVTPQLIVLFTMALTAILCFFFMLFSDVNSSTKLEAFCVISGVFQGVHKLYVAFFYSGFVYNLFEMLRKLHLEYKKHPEIGPALKEVCVYGTILIELLTVAFYCVITSYMLLPTFLWQKYGIFTTIFPIQFPFIDWHTTFGYTINTIHHTYCVCIGLTGILSGDAVFVYLILHTIAYRKIFECRINQLDKLLLKPGPKNSQKIKAELEFCIQAHQDHIKYIRMLNKIYSQLCMSQLITSEILLSTALIMFLWVKWIIGPFVSFVGLFQLLQYCILGTVVTVQNDKVSEIIYGFSWYLMPVEQQKLVVFMILRAQHPTEIKVGRFAKLNVATAMSILKMTYSFVMMMLEFLS